MVSEPTPFFIAKTAVFVAIIVGFSWKLASYKGLPNVLIVMAVLIVVYDFVTNRTTIGRRIYALGGNEKAARLSGIDTRELTRIIRMKGAPNGVIAHAPDGVFDIEALVAKARAWKGLVGLDLAKDVSCTQSYTWNEQCWAWPQFSWLLVCLSARRWGQPLWLWLFSCSSRLLSLPVSSQYWHGPVDAP